MYLYICCIGLLLFAQDCFRGRERDRQTDRQRKERERHRQTERERERERERESERNSVMIAGLELCINLYSSPLSKGLTNNGMRLNFKGPFE